MSHLLRALGICALASVCALAPAHAADKLRLAIQKTGSLAWELDFIKAWGLDKSAELELEISELASPEAGKIALRGGSADIVVSDWLWVSRERSLGSDLVFAPYSSTIGAVMVPATSAIAGIKDLKGKKFGIAGGAIDKSWLMLQAYGKRGGIDLKQEASLVFAAPPLLAEKAVQGEMDAVLNFWNFCADLEARGFKSLVAMDDVEKALGAKGSVAMLGYVFDGGFAKKNADALARFLKITRQAKEGLAASPEEWWRKMAPQLGAKDGKALEIYRRRYAEGIPRRTIAEEEADARTLYHVLAETGGAELVGTATELDPGTYYKAGSGN